MANHKRGSVFERDSVGVSIGLSLGRFHSLFRFIGAIAVTIGFVYLIWRLYNTQDGANPLLFWMLWSAETVGWVSLILFVRDSWSAKKEHAAWGPVHATLDILIPTFDEPISILQPTIIGATLVRGDTNIWVLDDGDREWVRELARQHGVNYVTRLNHDFAKAGNLNHALPLLRGDFMLVLDADLVPQPGIGEEMLGYFVDDRVAVVQSPHGFRNLDSVQHLDPRINEQSLFFDVLLPGRGRSSAVFWCGSGAIIRTRALRGIGGLSTKTITEDLETSIALQRDGWKIVYHNQVLLQGLAPHNLESFLIQRYRWARGTLQVLLSKGSPIFGRGFRFGTRLSYLSNLVYYLVPLQHLVFVMVLATALISGWMPIAATTEWFVLFWVTQMLLAQLTIWGMSAGRQIPFTGTRNAWTTSFVYTAALFGVLTNSKTKFKVTPKIGVERGGWAVARLLALPILAVVILTVSISLRLVNETFRIDLLLPISPIGQAFLYGFAALELAIIAPHVFRLIKREQFRSVFRLPVSLQAEIDGISATVVDLHESGARVIVHTSDIADLAVNGDYPISIHLGGTPEKVILGRLTPSRRARRIGGNGWMLGGQVSWNSESSKREVMTYCYVTNPGTRELR